MIRLSEMRGNQIYFNKTVGKLMITYLGYLLFNLGEGKHRFKDVKAIMMVENVNQAKHFVFKQERPYFSITRAKRLNLPLTFSKRGKYICFLFVLLFFTTNTDFLVLNTAMLLCYLLHCQLFLKTDFCLCTSLH